MNYAIGMYYTSIHMLFSITISSILLFSNNITYLFILLIVIVLDMFINTVCHDCPLTSLEEKYLQTSTTQKGIHTFLELGIGCKCDHLYDKQLFSLLNVLMLILGKIIFIMFSKLFLSPKS